MPHRRWQPTSRRLTVPPLANKLPNSSLQCHGTQGPAILLAHASPKHLLGRWPHARRAQAPPYKHEGIHTNGVSGCRHRRQEGQGFRSGVNGHSATCSFPSSLEFHLLTIRTRVRYMQSTLKTVCGCPLAMQAGNLNIRISPPSPDGKFQDVMPSQLRPRGICELSFLGRFHIPLEPPAAHEIILPRDSSPADLHRC